MKRQNDSFPANKRGFDSLHPLQFHKSGKVETDIVSVTYADGKTLKVRRPRLKIFQPTSPVKVIKGTSSGGAATCPVTGYTTSVESVRRQLITRRGGAEDARLIWGLCT